MRICVCHTCTHSYRGNAAEGGGGVSANAPQTRLVSLSLPLALCVLIMPHWSSAIAKRMMERLVWRLACGDDADCKAMGEGRGGGECCFLLRLCTFKKGSLRLLLRNAVA